MIQPTLWNQILVWPIVNLLIIFYKLFSAAHIPGALGLAIIGLTIVIRLILYPLMTKQLVSAKQMSALKPKLDELSKKFSGDKQKLQQAQLSLYKEHGINPASGCVPMLVQFPLLIALYGVFNQVLDANNLNSIIESINKVLYLPQWSLNNLDLSFFGASLVDKPSQWQSRGIWLLLIPIVTALLQWYQSKLMLPQESQTNQNIKKTKKDDKTQEDMAQDMQKQMAIMMPIMFGFFAYQFPLGLSIYWNTFGIFGIVQQILINKKFNKNI